MAFNMFLKTRTRKYITITTSAFACLAILAVTYFYFNIYTETKIIDVSGTYLKLNGFNELENKADVILIGTPTNTEGKTYATKYSTGALESVATITNFKVDKVIKKPEDLQISDTMEIYQPGGTIQTLNGRYKMVIEDYQDLEAGKKYVVYLAKNYLGGYSVIYNNNGRFVIDGDDEKADNQSSDIKRAVLHKYMSQK